MNDNQPTEDFSHLTSEDIYKIGIYSPIVHGALAYAHKNGLTFTQALMICVYLQYKRIKEYESYILNRLEGG